MGELVKKEEAPSFVLDGGHTLSEILEMSKVPETIHQYVVLHVNGKEITQDQWGFFVTADTDLVDILIRPMGGDDGKAILRLVATIVIAIVAITYGGPLAANLLNLAPGVAAPTWAVYTAQAVIAVVGTLAISALIPPPSLNLPGNSYDTGESYFLTGQSNQARPYQIVPVLYGRMKMVGNLAAQPETFSAGDSTVLTSLIDFGLGANAIYSIKAGDTKIAFFNAQQIIHEDTPALANPLNPADGLAPVPLQLLQYPLKSLELSVGLSKDGDTGISNTVDTAYSAAVELYFPQGIAYYDRNGEIQQLGVSFTGEYRKTGTTEWLDWPQGTQGFAGDDHLRFGQGIVGPPDPNPGETAAITFNLSSSIETGAQFTIDLEFTQDVYQVDNNDLKIVKAGGTIDATNRFTLISVVEIVSNRTWRWTFIAPDIADDTSEQFFVATNLNEFVDAPPPNGVAFPDSVYNSTNFAVVGEGGDAGPGIPEDDTDLYDRSAGNETYVLVVGTDPFNTYVPGDTSSWSIGSHSVWVDGATVPSNTQNFIDYAGTFQDYRIDSNLYVGTLIFEYWSLKNSTGAPGRIPGFRFVPNFPGLDPDYFGSRFSVYGDETRPGKVSIVIQFPEKGNYEIKLTRVGDTENNTSKNQYFNAAYWSRITSRGYPFTDIEQGRRSILNLKRRHTMMELQLEASERVQGNLSQITAMAVSKVRRHDGTGFTEPVTTRNPAWIVLDLLTGYRAQQVRYPYDLQDCPGYVQEDQLDIFTFRRFANVCAELVTYTYKGVEETRPRYTIDIVVAGDNPMMETVQNILGQCRAQLVLNQSGKIAVMMDDDRGGDVRQLFSGNNYWDFKGERLFPKLPHGLKVEFISPELGYQKGETIVYRPGYTADNATLFEDLKTYGVTNWHMAAQYGMYIFGSMALRQELFTMKVAAESLVVQRGDVVELQSEAAAFGGKAHLIVSQVSRDTFMLSEEPSDYNNPAYTAKINGEVYQGKVLGQVGTTVQLDIEFPVGSVNGSGSAIIVIGEENLVTKKYIINAIRPLPDLSAEITMIPYDAALYKTDEGEFPEWTPGGDGDPQNPNNGGNARTVDLTGFSFLEYNDRQPISVSRLAWDLLTADAELSAWKIQWTMAGSTTTIDVDRLPGSARGYDHKYQSNTNEFGVGYYTVTPVLQLGYDGQGAGVYVGKSIDRIPPPKPSEFFCVVQPGWLKFYWETSDAPDRGGYTIFRNTANDFDTATVVGQASYNDNYRAFPFNFNYDGEYFWIICTDTSGNDSEPALYDGLQNGVPLPGLVEPFDYETEGSPVPRLTWDDLYDPYMLINYYELRCTADELQMDWWPSDFMGGFAPGTEVFDLSASNFPQEGSYFIRAVDFFGNTGPWNRTSSKEADYAVEVVSFTQQITHIDRMPFSDVYMEWRAVGSEAGNINLYRVTLYPRQAEPSYYNREIIRNADPIVIYEGMDLSTTAQVNQIPRGDLYHQGEIIIEGLVDGLMTGTARGVIDWQIEYDEQGPEAPPDFAVVQSADQSVITWSPVRDPDPDVYEIRYSSRSDGPWQNSQVIAQLPWDSNLFSDVYRPGKYMIRCIDTSGNVGDMSTFILNPGNIDPNDGWEFLQNIQGHIEWNGVRENLTLAPGTSTLLLDDDTPIVDGVQTAYFYYDETSVLDVLGEYRIINETLVAFGEAAENWLVIADWPLLSDVENMAQTGDGSTNVDLFHEMKLPGTTDWVQFDQSEIITSGEVFYRIRLVNNIPGADAGIERSRILIYKKEDESP